VLRNDDLEMITPLILAKGEGTVDIGADSVDYVLRVALAGGGKEKDRIFVPITVKGPFEDLDYGVDLAAVAKDRLRQEVEKQVDEQVNRQIEKQIEQVAPGAGGAVGEVLKKGLGGFLGR
jgi:AsmA protein